MSFIQKIERKFGKFSIQGLTRYIVICYAIGYALSYFAPSFLDYLTLEPALIFKGQVWRILTWVIMPPGSSLDIFTVIMLVFYYSIGTNLERAWGDFKYNLYIFSGLLFTVLGAFIIYFILTGMGYGNLYFGRSISTYFISMSICLAFAVTFPEMQVLLYFIIPLKVKWMGILWGAYILYAFINSTWFGRIMIFVSLLNFIIFFFSNRDLKHISPGEIKRRSTYRKAVQNAQNSNITRHKCAVCGRTEKDDPNLEFRFCSKCDGNYEYCQDHLFTHEHVHTKDRT